MVGGQDGSRRADSRLAIKMNPKGDYGLGAPEFVASFRLLLVGPILGSTRTRRIKFDRSRAGERRPAPLLSLPKKGRPRGSGTPGCCRTVDNVHQTSGHLTDLIVLSQFVVFAITRLSPRETSPISPSSTAESCSASRPARLSAKNPTTANEPPLFFKAGQSLPSHLALVRINVRFPTSSDRLSEITKASLRAIGD
jgi:hypothetical protein